MPDDKKQAVTYLIENYKISERKACKLMNIARSSYSYVRKQKDDQPYIVLLDQLTQKHVSIGFWQSYHRIRKIGVIVNHKKLYRIYTSMKLNLRRRAKKRLPARVKQQLFQPDALNQVWSIDFMSDSLWDGRKIRFLNVIDDYNREVLLIEPNTSIPSAKLVRSLNELIHLRGIPSKIRVDNGPEFISATFDTWCKEKEIQLVHIQPGEPTQNAFIERFNGTFRRDVLNAYIFKSVPEIKEIVNHWMHDYNYKRPHKALNNKTPIEFLEFKG